MHNSLLNVILVSSTNSTSVSSVSDFHQCHQYLGDDDVYVISVRVMMMSMSSVLG